MLKQMIIALSLMGATVAANAQEKAVYGNANVSKVSAVGAVKGKDAGNVASSFVLTQSTTGKIDPKEAYGKAQIESISPATSIKGSKAGNVASTVVIVRSSTGRLDVKSVKIAPAQ
jgi:hypothetical protein